MSFRDSIDSLLHSRRERRSKTVREDWVETVADAVNWETIGLDSDLDNLDGEVALRGTLAFTLNGERHYGLVYSVPLGKSDAKNFLDSTDRPMQMKVRYDPANPDEMFAVAKYGDLPFEICEEE
jgi:hypothetical protein